MDWISTSKLGNFVVMSRLYSCILMPLLVLVVLFSGNGLTICKMACEETGKIEISLNSEGNCCEEEEDACCNEQEEDDCCSHNDNTVQLDNYINATEKSFNDVAITATSALRDLYILVNQLEPTEEGINSPPAPPPLQVTEFRTLVHSYII